MHLKIRTLIGKRSNRNKVLWNSTKIGFKDISEQSTISKSKPAQNLLHMASSPPIQKNVSFKGKPFSKLEITSQIEKIEVRWTYFKTKPISQ